jgi:hypothetical protein
MPVEIFHSRLHFYCILFIVSPSKESYFGQTNFSINSLPFNPVSASTMHATISEEGE